MQLTISEKKTSKIYTLLEVVYLLLLFNPNF